VTPFFELARQGENLGCALSMRESQGQEKEQGRLNAC
jgi:hypothetical protein